MYIQGTIIDFATRLHQLPANQNDLNNFITEGNNYISTVSNLDINQINKWNLEFGKKSLTLFGNSFYIFNNALSAAVSQQTHGIIGDVQGNTIQDIGGGTIGTVGSA